MIDKIDIKQIIEIAVKAGEEILKVYNEDFSVEIKDDKSPLTLADKKSNDVIVEGLKALELNIPIISEETKLTDYTTRKHWEYCWLVDPLDGTKEFIKRNGEFTVNIALIHNGEPVLGVIYVPVPETVYWSIKGEGSFKINGGEQQQIRIKDMATDKFAIVGSRSHSSPEMEAYVAAQKEKFKEVDFVAAGSSLKFCLVAEGKADVYPRLAPTMEWDTGAGQAIAMGAGAEVLIYGTKNSLTYNREDLLNPHFIVKHPEL